MTEVVKSAGLQSTHITGLFPELLGVGGVQEAGRLTALAIDEIARRRNWSASFAGLNDPGDAQQLSIGGHSIALQGFGRAKARFVFAAIGSARAAHNCRSHVIVAGHPNLAPIAVWLQKMSPRAHAIVMTHGVEVWQPLPLVRRATIRSARFVTAPSTDTIQKLIDVQHIACERTRLLPWPLSPDFLRFAERADLPAPAGFPEGRVILTIGRAAASERYKGTDDLIRAIGQLHAAVPGLQLVSVGGGDDLARLQSIAREESVANRVHFLQRLSREELAACYARAEIFAMPSAGEGFGLVFLEAMAFGKPVVAASAGGALDLVQDGTNGLLVPQHEPVALAAALQRLLRDGTLRSTLGAQGAAIARGKYQFGSLCAALEKLFEECAMHSENLK